MSIEQLFLGIQSNQVSQHQIVGGVLSVDARSDSVGSNRDACIIANGDSVSIA